MGGGGGGVEGENNIRVIDFTVNLDDISYT